MSALQVQHATVPTALLFRRYSSAGLAQGAIASAAAAGRRAQMAFRPEGNRHQPFVVEPIREQLQAVGAMLALMVVMGAPLFMAADWLRYGGVS